MKHISVRVTPKAKSNKVLQLSDTSFRVWVSSVPEKGKANKKVIELLADFLNIKKSQLRFIAGKTSRDKIFEIESQELDSGNQS